jgi:hypothetical protein
MPHSPATPVDYSSDIIVGFRAVWKIEERSRIPNENRGNVL